MANRVTCTSLVLRGCFIWENVFLPLVNYGPVRIPHYSFKTLLWMNRQWTETVRKWTTLRSGIWSPFFGRFSGNYPALLSKLQTLYRSHALVVTGFLDTQGTSYHTAVFRKLFSWPLLFNEPPVTLVKNNNWFCNEKKRHLFCSEICKLELKSQSLLSSHFILLGNGNGCLNSGNLVCHLC